MEKSQHWCPIYNTLKHSYLLRLRKWRYLIAKSHDKNRKKKISMLQNLLLKHFSSYFLPFVFVIKRLIIKEKSGLSLNKLYL